MANKTKNELLEDIEAMRKELDEKENQLLKYEHISGCTNAAEEYKIIYDKYVEAGFTKEEAFELLKVIMNSTIREFMNFDTRIRYGRVSYNRYR